MIKLEQLTKKFEQETVLDQIDLEIPDQKIFGIIGTSGAGKSTLIRLINGLEQPTSGRVILPPEVKISMIFQSYALLRSKTVYENIELALRFDATPKQDYPQKITAILAYVGLENKAAAYPAELSGGQKQRVGIARALVTNPALLLCDEITSALDPQAKKMILRLLQKINREFQTTIVLVTHEMDVIKEICDEVAVIHQGKIIERQTTTQLFLTPQSPITQTFLADIIYPTKPPHSPQSVYYALLDFAHYRALQTANLNGYIYDSQTLTLNGQRYFSLYYVTSDSTAIAYLQQNALRCEVQP